MADYILKERLSTDYGKAQAFFGTQQWTTIKGNSTGDFSLDNNKRPGIAYTNTVAGNKMNLYYFNGGQETILVRELKSLFWEGSIDNFNGTATVPYIVVYTKPTGIGDYDISYHSRRIYSFDIINTRDNEIGVGEKTCYWAINNPIKENFAISSRGVELKIISTNGDYTGTEEILYITIESDSSANAGEVKCLMENLGFQSTIGNARKLHLVGVDRSSNDATEATQLLMLAELQDINTVLSNGLPAIEQGTLLNTAITNGNVYTSSSVNSENHQDITIFGSINQNCSARFLVQISSDNVNWTSIQEIIGIYFTADSSTNYFVNLRSEVQYFRIVLTSDTNGNAKFEYAMK